MSKEKYFTPREARYLTEHNSTDSSQRSMTLQRILSLLCYLHPTHKEWSQSLLIWPHDWDVKNSKHTAHWPLMMNTFLASSALSGAYLCGELAIFTLSFEHFANQLLIPWSSQGHQLEPKCLSLWVGLTFSLWHFFTSEFYKADFSTLTS